ncbi:hypothetical protein LINPERHAP2_LOCUS6914 [Linum perenne]
MMHPPSRSHIRGQRSTITIILPVSIFRRLLIRPKQNCFTSHLSSALPDHTLNVHFHAFRGK